MAKRAHKLQEFVAHSAGVKCLKISKKACKLLVTGGEDRKVNIWAIGKPTSLADSFKVSLSGHTCPVESVAFDSAETLVLGGASTGAVKLWDLEETKMVRTLTGHRSNCTAVEFHPFGEFFASGSQDTNLKLWDIRKKGCIHTYKGHTAGIGTIRFSPDGRWVVSGGFDDAVKIWDLTAGKLLHNFKFHEGHIQSIDFHPHEFLLATGSADRTVKFWDLETFELIGSTRPEATGVCVITFHPDGRTLFCGLNDSLKVYSWEPVICHDAVDVGWSKLSDICIHEGKLLGCSCYQNSVGLWVADVSFMEPYGVGFVSEQTGYLPHRFSPKEKQSFEKLKGSNSPGFHCLSPERQTIKDIYVGPTGAKPVSLQRVGSLNSSMVLVPLDSKDITSLPIQEQSPVVSPPARSTGHSMRGPFLLPTIVPRVNTDGKQSNARRESITTVRADTGILCKSSHRRRSSETKYAVERLSVVAKSGSLCNLTRDLDSLDSKLQTNLTLKNESRESSKGIPSNSKIATEKFEKTWSQATNSCQESCDESFSCNAGISPDKLVIPGRTRYLVEKFEKGEKFKSEDHVAVKTSSMLKTKPERQLTSTNDDDVIEDLMRSHDVFLSTLCCRLTKLQVMRQFWERNDLKGGISAIRKLPDHSVQADVITVLMEKMEIITLDLFLCLLPVLSSLLESPMERHANISLEMLLKLVAVFGSTVRSTISAPRFVGVDLHAEHRLECCKQCSIELQKIQKLLPPLIKRGGMLEKCAHELNLLLQHP